MFVVQDAGEFEGPIEVASTNGFVSVPSLQRSKKPAFYRGTFELTKVPNKNNQFSLINILDLGSYLRGVVPNEMPTYFGLEALKAQTITARNYVLKPREKNFYNFDVCDSVACQVYFGANTEAPLSDKAIAETDNLVAMYNGDLILALYSSTAGGYTESYENAFSEPASKIFPANPKPYLKGVPDTNMVPLLDTEDAVKKFYTTVPTTYDNKSPYFRWQRDWTAEELTNILKKTVKTQSSTGFVKPALTNEEDFGTLKEIKIIKRGVSGKVMIMNIITDKNTYTVQKELVIRRIFTKDNKPLPSANIVFDLKKDAKGKLTNIKANGGGFGHGVGMSQWGAGLMASTGKTYDDILRHYYSGISITTYPVILTNECGQDTASQNFYANSKNAQLIVENNFQFTDLTVIINAQELKLELAPHLFKPVVFDLSPYMNIGKNNITYILPYTDTRKKSVRMYVELKN